MDAIIRFIYDYGLIAMFFLILLEYACFPVSSEIVLPFSGAVASLNCVPFMIILLISILAGLIGTSFCYCLGRFGYTLLFGRQNQRFQKLNSKLNLAMQKFQKLGPFAVCIGRLIPLCRTYIAFAAGMAKQPFRTFLSFSAVGIAIWNAVLIGIGYYLREEWDTVTYLYDKYKALIIPILLLIILFYIYYRKCRKTVKAD